MSHHLSILYGFRGDSDCPLMLFYICVIIRFFNERIVAPDSEQSFEHRPSVHAFVRAKKYRNEEPFPVRQRGDNRGKHT